MSDSRFYIQHNYQCAECGYFLEWRNREDVKDSMVLFHGDNGYCSKAGKSFYAPVEQLAEYIPIQ